MPPNKEHGKADTNQQPQPPITEGNFLYIATAKIEGGKPKITITRGKLIEQLMFPQDLQRTGLNKLTAQELAALNAFLDPSLVLAPGPGNEGPH
jgi:hypothetical protein